MSSSSSPCAACKFLRRKCTQECVFAPYFPADQPQKFASVHKVFGASNVAKILSELNVTQREEAVRSLVYEADARLGDPVYGCVGLISFLQQRLRQLHLELDGAKKELSTYIGPQAMAPMLHPPPPFMQQQQHQQNLGYASTSSSVMPPHGMMPMMGLPSGPIHGGQLVMREPLQQQQQHIIEAQQLAAAVAAREQQDMYRAYEQQQQQQQQPQQLQQQQHQQLDLLRSNSGFEGTGPVTATGFHHHHHHLGAGGMSPSLALGTSDNSYQVQQQAADNQWLLFQPEQAEAAHPHPQSQLQQPLQSQQQSQFSGSEERGSAGPC